MPLKFYTTHFDLCFMIRPFLMVYNVPVISFLTSKVFGIMLIYNLWDFSSSLLMSNFNSGVTQRFKSPFITQYVTYPNEVCCASKGV